MKISGLEIKVQCCSNFIISWYFKTHMYNTYRCIQRWVYRKSWSPYTWKPTPWRPGNSYRQLSTSLTWTVLYFCIYFTQVSIVILNVKILDQEQVTGVPTFSSQMKFAFRLHLLKPNISLVEFNLLLVGSNDQNIFFHVKAF